MNINDVARLTYGKELTPSNDATLDSVLDLARENSYSINRAAVTDAVKKHVYSEKIENFANKKIPAISHPRGVTFKRRDDKRGVNAYFYGKLDETDEQVGQPVKTLFEWNEVIHHRVRSEDLIFMASDDYKGLNPFLKDTFKSYSIDKVISIIGTNGASAGVEGLYSVGKGYVFYLAPGTLETKFSRTVFDQSSGPASQHSIFKDRLTFLYDLVDLIQFCFYATPRGDIVCEMPFFDYDPEFFFKAQAPDLFDTSNNDSYQDLLGKNEYDVTDISLYDALVPYREVHEDYLDGSTTTSYYSDAFDYRQHFTVETPEQMGFSNTSTDEGVLTMFTSMTNTIRNFKSMNSLNRRGPYHLIKELIPTLGLRIGEDQSWNFIDTIEGDSMQAALMLNRTNAEARTVAVQTVPKFGLMVNRPLFWKHRNYYGNIVSLNHSITWNSDINTTINLNQVRGWSGEVDPSSKNPIHRHFGDSNRPFNMAEFLDKALSSDAANKKDKGDM